MTDTTIPIRDAAAVGRSRRVFDDGAAGISPVNAEHPAQRQQLLDALAPLLGTLTTKPAGSLFTDRTVGSLSAGQAAGTSAIIAANASRRLLAITPANDGTLIVGKADGTPGGFFYPLFAGLTFTLSGVDCPTNALFVTGQVAAAALPMAEV